MAVIVDVYEYFDQKEREYASLSLTPDRSYPAMFSALDGSDGQHYGTDVWTTVQQNAAKLGKPTAAPAYANGKWTRSFEHGSVTVTPGVSAAVTLS